MLLVPSIMREALNGTQRLPSYIAPILESLHVSHESEGNEPPVFFNSKLPGETNASHLFNAEPTDTLRNLARWKKLAITVTI